MYESNNYTTERTYTVEGFNQFVAKVYGWMFLGLIITVVTSLVIVPNILQYMTQTMFYIIFFAEIGIVFYFSSRVLKMSYTKAGTIFIIYSVLNGITLSLIFMIYSLPSILVVLGITCLTFGVMAVYGYFTKTDLSSVRSFLIVGLFGVIILSIVNIFLNSSELYWFVSALGLLVFWGLTAYDMQKLKAYYIHGENQPAIKNNLALIGALALYLDFVNIFLLLLRFFGRRR